MYKVWPYDTPDAVTTEHYAKNHRDAAYHRHDTDMTRYSTTYRVLNTDTAELWEVDIEVEIGWHIGEDREIKSPNRAG